MDHGNFFAVTMVSSNVVPLRHDKFWGEMNEPNDVAPDVVPGNVSE